MYLRIFSLWSLYFFLLRAIFTNQNTRGHIETNAKFKGANVISLSFFQVAVKLDGKSNGDTLVDTTWSISVTNHVYMVTLKTTLVQEGVNAFFFLEIQVWLKRKNY